MNSNHTSIPNILEQIRQRHNAMVSPGPISEQPSASPISPFVPASTIAYSKLEIYFREQGVLQEIGEQLVEEAFSLRPAPGSLEEQLELAETILQRRWRVPRRDGGAGETHIFVGPHGSGKTTVLSKWLAQAVLLAGQSARVLRLDGSSANTAESLTVYSEVLGVPVLRSWPQQEPLEPADVTFVDLPGLSMDEPAALADLHKQCAAFPGAQIHLVLNGAYETSLLLGQAAAFSRFKPSSLIVSHLDEELRWAKLINFLFRTDLPLSWLGAGQNVPGGLLDARPRHLLPRGLARKSGASVLSQAA